MIYLLAIIIAVIFGIWGAIGKTWYWYILNFILLFAASSIFNTTYIQCITRCYSVVILKGIRGIGENLHLIAFTLIWWIMSYGITRIVFQDHLQIGLFFLSCLAVATIVAFVDNLFNVAVERTRLFTNLEDKDKKS